MESFIPRISAVISLKAFRRMSRVRQNQCPLQTFPAMRLSTVLLHKNLQMPSMPLVRPIESLQHTPLHLIFSRRNLVRGALFALPLLLRLLMAAGILMFGLC